MKYLVVLVVFAFFPMLVMAIGEDWMGDRGDSNNDGVVEMSDAITIIEYVQLPPADRPVLGCREQADADGDGDIDGNDGVYLLSWLFLGGPAPPYPGPFNDDCTDVNQTIDCDDPICD